jgi:Protein of unknown function (DUF1071)
MSQENQNYFAKLSAINVSEHLEKKGQFSYLSWPFAVQQLRNFDEKATWAVMRFDGLPYQKTELGVFVEVSVTVQGVQLSQIHPVLDSKNRPLLEPSAFDINTSIQRCLVKAIALHGLGLNVYAGEDLPEGETPMPVATVKPPHLAHQKEAVLLTDKQLRYINKLIVETKTNEQQLLTFFGLEALEFIPKSEVNRVISVLENNRKEAA